MSGTETPNLGLQYLDPSQAQPEVKINDAWNKLDAAIGEGSGIAVSNATASPAIVARATELQFEGAGVTVTHETGQRAIISIPGGGSGPSSDTSSDAGNPILVTDGSTSVADIDEIHFTSGATVTASGRIAQVAISGGGGGGSGNSTYFGSGSPSGFHNTGDLYFDTSASPIGAYVQTQTGTSTPTVDGAPAAASISGTSSGTITVSTSAASTELLVFVTNEEAAVVSITSITGSGLTLNQIASKQTTNNGRAVNLEIWSAPLTSALTGEVLTITLSGTPDDVAVVAFGVIGMSGLDNAAGLPASAEMPVGGGTMSVSGFGTSVANDLILYVAATSQSSVGGSPSGYTLIKQFTNTGGADYAAINISGSVPGAIVSGQTVTSPAATNISAVMIMLALKGSSAASNWVKFN